MDHRTIQRIPPALLMGELSGTTNVKGQDQRENVRCKRLEIGRDGTVTPQDMDLRQPNPDEALESSNDKDVIFIVEGFKELLPEQLAAIGLQIPPFFFEVHLDRQSGRSANRNTESSDSGTFFASWSAASSQSEKQWTIEQKVRAGRPWDAETALDPRSQFTSHTRYGIFPELLYRSYHPLHPQGTSHSPGPAKGSMLHHSITCMSFYHTLDEGRLRGCLLVDPRRQHTFEAVKLDMLNRNVDTINLPNEFCFLGEQPSFERITDILLAPNSFSGVTSDVAVVQSIMGLVMEDMPMVLFEVSRGLDIIELSLSKDAELRSAVHHWRDYLGRWRNSLSHLSWSTSSMLEELKHHLEEVNAPSNPLVASSSRMKASALKHKVRQVTQLYNDLQTIATRVETTFEALMSTLSILESQRAITQAETISKLTHLAFFFIPLSFVATVFGMEVVEFQDELTWRLWLGISVGITASTYLTLYASEAWLMVSNLPTTIYDSIDWSTFSAIWTSGLKFLEKSFTSVRVFFALVAIVLGLGVLAGLAVVGTLLPFSTGATVGLSFGMAMSAICLIISFGVWLDALRRQIEGYNPVVSRNLTFDRGEKGRTDAELQALCRDPE